MDEFIGWDDVIQHSDVLQALFMFSVISLRL